jgi:hypothetical protein
MIMRYSAVFGDAPWGAPWVSPFGLSMLTVAFLMLPVGIVLCFRVQLGGVNKAHQKPITVFSIAVVQFIEVIADCNKAQQKNS